MQVPCPGHQEAWQQSIAAAINTSKLHRTVSCFVVDSFINLGLPASVNVLVLDQSHVRVANSPR